VFVPTTTVRRTSDRPPAVSQEEQGRRTKSPKKRRFGPRQLTPGRIGQRMSKGESPEMRKQRGATRSRRAGVASKQRERCGKQPLTTRCPQQRRSARFGRGNYSKLEPSKRGLYGGSAWENMPAMTGRGIESVRGRWLGRAPLTHAEPRHVCEQHAYRGAPAMTRGVRRDEVSLGRGFARCCGASSIPHDAERRRPSDGPAVERLQRMDARVPEVDKQSKGKK
jgi:hypothetical protein